MLRRDRRNVLWIVQDSEDMEKAEDDLLCFLGPDQVRLFPPSDVRPYQDDSPSREIMARRIATLYSLTTSNPAVIVAPLRALVGYTVPREEVLEAVIPLKAGTEVNRDDLSTRLVGMGYTREALIDDVGQFSVRGSIMDIFSPAMDAPVRLDMFGDEITAIKAFDIRSQRTTRELSSVTLLPAGEVILDPRFIRNARPRMRRLGEDRVRVLIEDLEQGIRTPGIESYLVLFYERPGSLLAYLPRASTVMTPDTEEIEALCKEIFDSYAHGYERARAHGRAAVEPEEAILKGSCSGSSSAASLALFPRHAPAWRGRWSSGRCSRTFRPAPAARPCSTGSSPWCTADTMCSSSRPRSFSPSASRMHSQTAAYRRTPRTATSSCVKAGSRRG
jgi:transcription-repair coupling factor (superfamily II helicase)